MKCAWLAVGFGAMVTGALLGYTLWRAWVALDEALVGRTRAAEKYRISHPAKGYGTGGTVDAGYLIPNGGAGGPRRP